MVEQVKSSHQRLRDFLADVSHELRTPLTSIRGFAQAIFDGTAEDKEAREKAAQIIEDESKLVIRLVDELLELSKIESGQIHMLQELVDVETLLKHCREIIIPQAEIKGIELSQDLDSLPSIFGDADRLEQVFSNLLDNALKHTPSGGLLSIAAKAYANRIEVIVTDSGPGIPPQELPYVFRRFYKAEGEQTGAGLGLAIAREIARSHGGDIEAKNTSGGGAEFIVKLPTSSPPL
jgi:two-component system sensor histidine kinase ResE